MRNFYSVLADVIVAFHFLYVSFAAGGEVLVLLGAAFKWKWIRSKTFRIIHLIAVLFVAIESVIGVLCPLTDWEYDLRQLAGQRVERDISFIGRLIRMIIFYDFPQWVFTTMYVGFGIMVLLTFILVPPHKLNRKQI